MDGGLLAPEGANSDLNVARTVPAPPPTLPPRKSGHHSGVSTGPAMYTVILVAELGTPIDERAPHT